MDPRPRPLRIAAFHAFLDKTRGAEFAFLHMVRSLRERGTDVRVFTLSASPPFEKELESVGVACRSFPPKHSLTTTPDYVRFLGLDSLWKERALLPVAAAMNAFAPDAHLVHHSFLAPRLMRHLHGRRVFYCQEVPRVAFEMKLVKKLHHHWRERFLSMDPLPRAIYLSLLPAKKAMTDVIRWHDRREFRRFAPLADCILVNSRHSQLQLREHVGLESEVCYLGVDTDRFRPGGPRRREVVSIGPLTPPLKGHEFVIRSVGRLPPHDRPPVLVVGGGAPNDVERLRKLAQEMDVDLQYEPRLDPAKMLAAYQEAGAVAIAYENEPFGLAAAEALACEAPVVAVPEGGIKEIVAPDMGWLAPRDELAFAAAIWRALSDAEEASRRAALGRAHISNTFSWAHCAAQLELHLSVSTRRKAACGAREAPGGGEA